MAIRMIKDDPEQSGDNGSNRGDNRGGGMGNLLTWLPLAIFFLLKRPKLLFPILIIGGIWYFFLGGDQVLNGGAALAQNEEVGDISDYALGASLSQERFDRAQVFEPLASEVGGRNVLPSRVSLQQYAPSVQHQGAQGSCVGWASAYAARTILEAQATKSDPNRVRFSPAYLYNQIHLDDCNGAYMLDAMKTMQANGCVPFEEFGYDEETCANYPSKSDINLGQRFRIRGYNRLTRGAEDYRPDLLAIKQNLAQGAPVVIGTMVGGSFMDAMEGQEVWIPQRNEYAMKGFGGHAMCLVGYDDNKAGGAFQIMNSWGPEWGKGGYAWIRYSDFEHFTKEAYGLNPLGSAKPADRNKLGVEFALFDYANQKIIPLQGAGELVFRTRASLQKGSKFKVLIANTIECYVYLFGQEADGRSTVLFPYTAKHSPFCGITGTRLFPRDYSLSPDQTGNRDYLAAVFSKTELDYQKLNAAINQAAGRNYAEKLQSALGKQRIRTVRFQPGQTIAFEANATEGASVGVVIEIDKR